MQSSPVGVIGLGLLGSAFAQRLISAGHVVVGYDPDPARTYLLGALAGKAATSAREVFKQCPRILLALPDNTAVQEAVYRNADSFLPGVLLIDTTSADPEPTVRLGREVRSRGARYVDAIILGSSEQARTGDLLVVCGGEIGDVASARDILASFARQIHHAGPHGSGARLKLAVNLVQGLHRAVLAEGLSFALKCGLEPGLVLEVLKSGAAYSRVMDLKGEKMLARDFQPQARLAQHFKEVRLALAEAARVGARAPLSATHLALLEQVVTMGCGDEDTSAILRAFD
jgi:3-hydroxyisobutyrate dehydrogenase-like beta-hydroxyacid dehydrogenase